MNALANLSGQTGRSPSLFLLLLCGCLLAGCGSPEETVPSSPAQPSVVLVSIDTLRSDRLPAYGYDGGSTPHLDAFARESVLFERVYSHYPMTLPAHASLFTGLVPPRHGVRDNREFVLLDDLPTLADRLREIGFRTAGVVSTMVLRKSTGISRGFDYYDADIAVDRSRGELGWLGAERRGETSLALALEWLDGLSGDQPFFLFIHLFDPHTPYDAPEPFASRHQDPYDAEIAYTDHVVGTLFDALEERGLYTGSLVVVLSDHGEGLGDHVETEHGLLVYREALQVPLMIRLPGGERGGTRIDSPAGLVDVAPTVLAVLGVESPDLPGIDLLADGAETVDRPLYGESFWGHYQYAWATLRSIVLGDLHYIEAPTPELYDLREDPEERRNLLGTREVPQEMLDALESVGEGIESAAGVSRQDAERLAALGYVGGFVREDAVGVGDDPKERVHDLEELLRTVDRLGKTDSLDAEGRALELMRKIGVRNEEISRTVANNMMRWGRMAEAAAVLEPFAGTHDPETLQLLGKIAAESGRLGEAADLFGRVLEADPRHPQGHLGTGIVLMRQGRFAEAELPLRRAVELDAGLAEAWNGLAVIRASRNDLRGAIAAWEKAVDADPELADAWHNLSIVYERLGDDARAGEARARYRSISSPGPS